LNWQPSLTEMSIDMTGWTGDEGQNVEIGQTLWVRPDSTTVDVVGETRRVL